ncbi:hypothetical protein GF380_05455 [Candidatus Uhrbacteria bacterium]|nr:hypothetical protein [Candidatus Uhrbacteria bacterium]MBD3284477.1 hypothetical protein [Candidatus Uhrbacteria bacterium]
MKLPPQAIQRPYKLMTRKEIADGILEMQFEPEHPEDRIPEFLPGQWVNLYLSNPDGTPFAKAAYSIACAPSDVGADGRLTLGVAMARGFTQRLAALQVGDIVRLQGPFGVFTLPASSERLTFFAGGIGITPLRSMIREALSREDTTPITLFYSCKTMGSCAWLEEFRELAASHERFSFVPILTREEVSDWDGECGRCSAQMIDRHVADANGAFLLCGPTSFMESVIGILESKGVHSKQIHQERFS